MLNLIKLKSRAETETIQMTDVQLEKLKRNKKFHIYHTCMPLNKGQLPIEREREIGSESDRDIAAQGQLRNEFAFTLIDGFRWPFSGSCMGHEIYHIHK